MEHSAARPLSTRRGHEGFVRGSYYFGFAEDTLVIQSVSVCSTVREIVSWIVWYSLRAPVVQV